MKPGGLSLINSVYENIPLITSTLTSKYPLLNPGIIAKLTPPVRGGEITDENLPVMPSL
jgi:hypothetical protein